eukprot:TRINITY_DN7472_c0_g1_i1.p1 TRINITY_DN7472_c0_g1~~TRINITY_DN7472_c0_g1_i1.p1  ORF type:complete len:533 (-),score=76.15 TRINITY_DN7472_c0_g1_i1:190-1788(-)
MADVLAIFHQREDQVMTAERRRNEIERNLLIDVIIGVAIALFVFAVICYNHEESNLRCCRYPKPSYCAKITENWINNQKKDKITSMEDLFDRMNNESTSDIVGQTPQLVISNHNIASFMEDQYDPTQMTGTPYCSILTGKNGVGKNTYIRRVANAINNLSICYNLNSCADPDFNECERARGYLTISSRTSRNCNKILEELGEWLPSIRRRGFQPIVVFDEVHFIKMEDGSSFGECLIDIINSQTLIHPVSGAKFSMANVIVFATANHWAIHETLDESSQTDGVQAHYSFVEHPLYQELKKYRFNKEINITYFNNVESIMTPLTTKSSISDILARKLFNIRHEGYYRFIASKCPPLPFFDFDIDAASELFSSTIQRLLPKDLKIPEVRCHQDENKFYNDGRGVLRKFLLDTMRSQFNEMLKSANIKGSLDARRVQEYAKKYIRAHFRMCSLGMVRVVSAVKTKAKDNSEAYEIRTVCVNQDETDASISTKLCDAKAVETNVSNLWAVESEEPTQEANPSTPSSPPTPPRHDEL